MFPDLRRASCGTNTVMQEAFSIGLARGKISEKQTWNKYPELLTWIYVMSHASWGHALGTCHGLFGKTGQMHQLFCLQELWDHGRLPRTQWFVDNLQPPGRSWKQSEQRKMAGNGALYVWYISAVDFSSEFWHKLLEMLTRFFITITQIDGSI